MHRSTNWRRRCCTDVASPARDWESPNTRWSPVRRSAPEPSRTRAPVETAPGRPHRGVGLRPAPLQVVLDDERLGAGTLPDDCGAADDHDGRRQRESQRERLAKADSGSPSKATAPAAAVSGDRVSAVFQPFGNFAFACSSLSEGTMMTSSPCFQLTGVATLCCAVSWQECQQAAAPRRKLRAGAHRVGQHRLDLLLSGRSRRRAHRGIVGRRPPLRGRPDSAAACRRASLP